jgi:tetratricopeptide (TPR) repeat protein
MKRMSGAALVLLGSLFAAGGSTTPTRDDDVLARIHVAGVVDTQTQEIRATQRLLEIEPRNVEAASKLAWHYIRLGRTRGDARYAGYAQGVLRPWWSEATPPASILLLRATLKQNRHEFGQALVDLDRVLQLQPRNVQAWLTKSVVHLVRGEFRSARSGCQALVRNGRLLLGGTCMAEVLGRTGHGEKALSLLSDLSELARPSDPETRLWALTAAAEIAARLGHDVLAEGHFQAALGIGRHARTASPWTTVGTPPQQTRCPRCQPGDRDVYLLSAYADYLLDRGGNEAVLALLDGETGAPALRLRRAIAERRLGRPEYAGHGDSLWRLFELGRLGGGPGHPGDTARLLLHLMDRPDLALSHAKAYWESEKQPASARLLLEAARASETVSAARPVLRWVKSTGIEDRRLQALAAKFDGG